jgi:mono/diheme cytochrome c family protein
VNKGYLSDKRAIAIIAFVIILIVGYVQLKPPDAVARGEELYLAHCVACHGINGVGENPADIYAMDEYGFVAPPMDDSGHAWHHTDEQLIQMTLEGSPRNPRMAAFKNVLTEEDTGALVEYIKSLWSPYIRENCQGPKHMSCM